MFDSKEFKDMMNTDMNNDSMVRPEEGINPAPEVTSQQTPPVETAVTSNNNEITSNSTISNNPNNSTTQTEVEELIVPDSQPQMVQEPVQPTTSYASINNNNNEKPPKNNKISTILLVLLFVFLFAFVMLMPNIQGWIEQYKANKTIPKPEVTEEQKPAPEKTPVATEKPKPSPSSDPVPTTDPEPETEPESEPNPESTDKNNLVCTLHNKDNTNYEMIQKEEFEYDSEKKIITSRIISDYNFSETNDSYESILQQCNSHMTKYSDQKGYSVLCTNNDNSIQMKREFDLANFSPIIDGSVSINANAGYKQNIDEIKESLEKKGYTCE